MKIRVHSMTAEGERRSWDVSFLPPHGRREVPMGALVCRIQALKDDDDE